MFQGTTSATRATAEVRISHSWIGALQAWIGVQDGKEVMIWDKQGLNGNEINLTLNLYNLGFGESDLPPSGSKRWLLRVKDTDAYGDTGKIEKFVMTFKGTRYESADQPAIKDNSEVKAEIPSRPQTTCVALSASVTECVADWPEYWSNGVETGEGGQTTEQNSSATGSSGHAQALAQAVIAGAVGAESWFGHAGLYTPFKSGKYLVVFTLDYEGLLRLFDASLPIIGGQNRLGLAVSWQTGIGDSVQRVPLVAPPTQPAPWGEHKFKEKLRIAHMVTLQAGTDYRFHSQVNVEALAVSVGAATVGGAVSADAALESVAFVFVQ